MSGQEVEIIKRYIDENGLRANRGDGHRRRRCLTAGTRTSSPGRNPIARKAMEIASVPKPTPMPFATPQYRVNSSSNTSTFGPKTIQTTQTMVEVG